MNQPRSSAGEGRALPRSAAAEEITLRPEGRTEPLLIPHSASAEERRDRLRVASAIFGQYPGNTGLSPRRQAAMQRQAWNAVLRSPKRCEPPERTAIENNRGPKQDLKRLLPGLVAKQSLRSQSAWPAPCERDKVQGILLRPPLAVSCGRFVEGVRDKCDKTGGEIEPRDFNWQPAGNGPSRNQRKKGYSQQEGDIALPARSGRRNPFADECNIAGLRPALGSVPEFVGHDFISGGPLLPVRK